MTSLQIEPLSAEAFAPFGQVLQTQGAAELQINQGTTTRFDDLATADPGADGVTAISIFRGRRRPFPIRLAMLERHPLATQAFFPLSMQDWLVVVASEPLSTGLRCFRARGDQGVNYARGVWHHPLLVLDKEQDFLVVDRKGPSSNLEEVDLETPVNLDPRATTS